MTMKGDFLLNFLDDISEKMPKLAAFKLRKERERPVHHFFEGDERSNLKILSKRKESFIGALAFSHVHLFSIMFSVFEARMSAYGHGP
jgi:hypothetical protein